MALLLPAVPLLFGIVAWLIPSARVRPWWVAFGAVVHAVVVLLALLEPEVVGVYGWLGLDALGKIVLGLVATLFLACGLYAPAYLGHHPTENNRYFCTGMFGFATGLTLVAEAQHLGVLWVSLEATTLCGAPLIYFHRHRQTLEATWKYLLIGSVGVAIALLGSFFLGYAVLQSGHEPSLLLSDLEANAPFMSRPWLHAAFVLLLVGYGTKMGVAPMHSWKPDAYGEAPGIAGALLSGGATAGAFLALLRVVRVCVAAGDGEYVKTPLLTLGIFSMAVAALFVVRQPDYKRMLAYSSVEHMGLLLIGIGLGGAGVFAALLHLVNNGLSKPVMFLTAGNIQRAFGSKSTEDVCGAWRRMPISAGIFIAGFFAISGAPPFGIFLSEFLLVEQAISGGWFGVAAVVLLLLLVVFGGIASTVLRVFQGEPPESADGERIREPWLEVAPSAALLALALALGVYLPGFFDSLLATAASALGVP